MDILAEDLEITRLFGERLRTAREQNIELEKRLAAKTIECDGNLQRAQQSDANNTTLSRKLHMATLTAAAYKRQCTDPRHAFEILAVRSAESSTKSRLIEELAEQLRVESEAQKAHLKALNESQHVLAVCQQNYEEAKRQLKEAHQHAATPEFDLSFDAKIPIEDNATTFRQALDFVANFPSFALAKQLQDQIKRKFAPYSALPISVSDIQKHMAKERPSSHFHCFSEVAIKSGAHHLIVGPLHRTDVEQQHWTQAEWTSQSQFEKFHGKTLEVFSQTQDGKIRYLGKHTAIPMKNLQTNEYGALRNYIRWSLVNSVIRQAGWSQKDGINAARQDMISRLLNCGTIQTECLGLQFDGFDKLLNHSLQGILISAKEAKKLLHNSTPGSLEQGQAKKRKLDDADISSNKMISDVQMEESGVKAESDSEASEQEYGG